MTMKKTLLLSAFAVVLSLTACNKEVTENSTPAPVPSVGQTVHFTSVAPETKAAFTTPSGTHYPVLWTSNDTQMAVTMNYSSSPVSADVTRSADNKTASFNASFDNSGTSFQFVAVSPASAVKSVNTANQTVNLEVPSGQTPTATSPDESAIVLYAKSAEFNTFPDNVDMEFHHFTGYFHLVFTNYADALSDAGATVQSVSITSDKDIAGRFIFKPKDRTITKNSPAQSITVATSSLDDVWIGLAPVDLSNETISITIGTDKGTISKDVGFSSGCNLTSGKIAKVTVDMNGIDVVSPVRYNQVTNVNQLYVGDKVIITAARYDRVLSTTQNSNNRSATTITKGDGFILDPADAVEVLTLEDGVKPGEFAMKGKDNKYLYAPTGGNYLRSTATVNASQASLGSFAISIPASGQDSDKIDISYPAIMYVSASDHYIRYNNNSDGKGGYYNLFSTYAQSSSTKYVHLYRLDASPDLSPRFKASMPDDSDGDGNLDIVAAGGSLEVYVFGNSAWTATATGGATLNATSGTGNTILTLTVPENASTTDTKDYTVTVSTPAGVVPNSYTFNITQAVAAGGGGGGGFSGIKVDDILWAENWVGAVADQTPAVYLASGDATTTVYGGASVAYTSDSGNSTKMYAEGLVFLVNNKGTQKPSDYLNPDQINNLLVKKSGGWFKVANIPCTGVKTAVLTYKSNTTCNPSSRNITVTTDTANVTVSSLTPTTKSNSYTYESSSQTKTYYEITCTITFEDAFTGDTFNLQFNNGYSSNIRLTQFEVEVTAMK